MLEVRPSPRHGRGVFTTEPIDEGEVLEICPALPLDHEDTQTIDQTALGKYVFDWGEHRTAVAFGFVSFCNHGEANAEVIVRDDPPTVELVASRDIAGDEEILIDYGPHHHIRGA